LLDSEPRNPSNGRGSRRVHAVLHAGMQLRTLERADLVGQLILERLHIGHLRRDRLLRCLGALLELAFELLELLLQLELGSAVLVDRCAEALRLLLVRRLRVFPRLLQRPQLLLRLNQLLVPLLGEALVPLKAPLLLLVPLAHADDRRGLLLELNCEPCDLGVLL
jgi:hypothetical protein